MLIGKTITVTTSTTDILAGLPAGEFEVLIRHESLGVDVFLGDSSVSDTDGYLLNRNDVSPLRIKLFNEGLYAITDAGTGVIHVLAYSA
jgi:hypothetical protein